MQTFDKDEMRRWQLLQHIRQAYQVRHEGLDQQQAQGWLEWMH